eukprot:TRINITY_DN4751_c0_g1_i1.p1 TRINITY_DN4751_c0_g1~~TRINITY_DN4751_c0_g1_i1.p1  ORF type:complete len:960 (-),score=260.05 TRINITY_DN4751_c0_g1_i1:206-3085(-)
MMTLVLDIYFNQVRNFTGTNASVSCDVRSQNEKLVSINTAIVSKEHIPTTEFQEFHSISFELPKGLLAAKQCLVSTLLVFGVYDIIAGQRNQRLLVGSYEILLGELLHASPAVLLNCQLPSGAKAELPLLLAFEWKSNFQTLTVYDGTDLPFIFELERKLLMDHCKQKSVATRVHISKILDMEPPSADISKMKKRRGLLRAQHSRYGSLRITGSSKARASVNNRNEALNIIDEEDSEVGDMNDDEYILPSSVRSPKDITSNSSNCEWSLDKFRIKAEKCQEQLKKKDISIINWGNEMNEAFEELFDGRIALFIASAKFSVLKQSLPQPFSSRQEDDNDIFMLPTLVKVPNFPDSDVPSLKEGLKRLRNYVPILWGRRPFLSRIRDAANLVGLLSFYGINAWVILHSGPFSETMASVVTVIKANGGNDQKVQFWDASECRIMDHMKVRTIYRIGMCFNASEILVNVQNPDIASNVSWNFQNPSRWLSVWRTDPVELFGNNNNYNSTNNNSNDINHNHNQQQQKQNRTMEDIRNILDEEIKLNQQEKQQQQQQEQDPSYKLDKPSSVNKPKYDPQTPPISMKKSLSSKRKKRQPQSPDFPPNSKANTHKRKKFEPQTPPISALKRKTFEPKTPPITSKKSHHNNKLTPMSFRPETPPLPIFRKDPLLNTPKRAITTGVTTIAHEPKTPSLPPKSSTFQQLSTEPRTSSSKTGVVVKKFEESQSSFGAPFMKRRSLTASIKGLTHPRRSSTPSPSPTTPVTATGVTIIDKKNGARKRTLVPRTLMYDEGSASSSSLMEETITNSRPNSRHYHQKKNLWILAPNFSMKKAVSEELLLDKTIWRLATDYRYEHLFMTTEKMPDYLNEEITQKVNEMTRKWKKTGVLESSIVDSKTTDLHIFPFLFQGSRTDVGFMAIISRLKHSGILDHRLLKHMVRFSIVSRCLNVSTKLVFVIVGCLDAEDL